MKKLIFTLIAILPLLFLGGGWGEVYAQSPQSINYQGVARNNTGANNSSGFTALPGGNSWSGSFNSVGSYGNWWSATESSGINAWRRYLNYIEVRSNRGSSNKLYGISVRCVQD